MELSGMQAAPLGPRIRLRMPAAAPLPQTAWSQVTVAAPSRPARTRPESFGKAVAGFAAGALLAAGSRCGAESLRRAAGRRAGARAVVARRAISDEGDDSLAWRNLHGKVRPREKVKTTKDARLKEQIQKLVQKPAGGSASSSLPQAALQLPEGGLAGTSSTEIDLQKPQAAIALRKKSGFGKTMSKAPLMNKQGEIIAGGGDPPDAPGAKELFAWMEKRGCQGLEVIHLPVGGGVRLRALADKYTKGQVVLHVPQSCWLMAELGEDPTASLGWRLLQELWQGETSQYAPLANYLSNFDMLQHPAFWDDEELEWLDPSLHTKKEVMEKRKSLFASRDRLVDMARSEATATGLLPERLQGEEALRHEALWAVTMCEARGNLHQLADGSCVAALVPLHFDFRHEAAAKPPLIQAITSPEAGCMSMVAYGKIRPGQEITQKLQSDQMQSGHLLAQHGFVPGAGLPPTLSFEELNEINPNEKVALRIPTEEAESPNHRLMLRIVQEYAGLHLTAPRLDENLELENYSLTLMDDMYPCDPDQPRALGKLKPLARYLELGDVDMEEGDQYEWYKLFFNCVMRGVKLPNGPADVDWSKLSTDGAKYDATNVEVPKTLENEAAAGLRIVEWIKRQMSEYTMAIEDVARMTDLPLGREGAGNLKVGSRIMCHFKVKRPNGKTVKSKSSRECKVITLPVEEEDSTVAQHQELLLQVKFTENGRKQEVPIKWITGWTSVPSQGALQSGASPVRAARGKLAIALLRSERAFLYCMQKQFNLEFSMVAKVSRNYKEIVKGGKTGEFDEAKVEEAKVELEKFWRMLNLSNEPFDPDKLPCSMSTLQHFDIDKVTERIAQAKDMTPEEWKLLMRPDPDEEIEPTHGLPKFPGSVEAWIDAQRTAPRLEQGGDQEIGDDLGATAEPSEGAAQEDHRAATKITD